MFNSEAFASPHPSPLLRKETLLNAGEKQRKLDFAAQVQTVGSLLQWAGAGRGAAGTTGRRKGPPPSTGWAEQEGNVAAGGGAGSAEGGRLWQGGAAARGGDSFPH